MTVKPRWRLLYVPPRDGAENMARDVALMDYSRESGSCVLSVYTWSRPTLSFGRNQDARGLYDTARLESAKIDVVRRPTGGRAILHDHEITYSVTGPDSFASSLGEAYDRINALLLRGLSSVGASVEIATPTAPAPKPDQTPCFAEPVRGELVANGKKLVGSAQYRERGAFLQHGSILLANDQDRLSDLTLSKSAPAVPGPATLNDLLQREITPVEMATALFDAATNLYDSDATPMDESEIRSGALKHRSTFTDSEWTWRR